MDMGAIRMGMCARFSEFPRFSQTCFEKSEPLLGQGLLSSDRPVPMSSVASTVPVPLAELNFYRTEHPRLIADGITDYNA
eukprot:5261156-Prymnesium_polylepis.1